MHNEQQQMRLWPIWRRIDDAWRARTQTQDLIEGRSITEKIAEELTPQDRDGMSARGQNAALHKQIDALTTIGIQIAWDEGKPVRFTKPESVYEHPVYNPGQQSVDVGNSLLDQNIHDIDLRFEYRKNWGTFCKYGHAWAWTDFRMCRETVTDKYRVGPDPISAQAQMAMLMQRYQGQQPQTAPTIDGGYELSFQRKMLKEMTTGFQHLDVPRIQNRPAKFAVPEVGTKSMAHLSRRASLCAGTTGLVPNEQCRDRSATRAAKSKSGLLPSSKATVGNRECALSSIEARDRVLRGA